MLGTFRFILAWFVMLSHLPFSYFALNFNPAVSAVIMFYFISGFLMYKSISKERGNFFLVTKNFFIKRFLRIFPLYWIVLTFTIIAIYFLGESKYIPLLNQDLSLEKIVLNYILLFNNYVFTPFIIHSLLPHPLIPPTWSLSTEWHFYLLVPIVFFALNKRKLIYFVLVISLIFELYAFSKALPYFNSDNFGYRYIFGVLWIFLFGFIYSKYGFNKFLKTIYAIFVVYFLIYGFLYSNHPYVREISIAVMLLPFIPKLLDIEFKYDKFFGRLSYPIFLVHFLVFFISEKIAEKFHLSKIIYFEIVFILVFVFAFILGVIDSKIEKIRKNF